MIYNPPKSIFYICESKWIGGKLHAFIVGAAHGYYQANIVQAIVENEKTGNVVTVEVENIRFKLP